MIFFDNYIIIILIGVSKKRQSFCRNGIAARTSHSSRDCPPAQTHYNKGDNDTAFLYENLLAITPGQIIMWLIGGVLIFLAITYLLNAIFKEKKD